MTREERQEAMKWIPEERAAFVTRFPRLHRRPDGSLRLYAPICGRGWIPLLERVFAVAEAERVTIREIKVKYGSLRIDMANEEVEQLVDEWPCRARRRARSVVRQPNRRLRTTTANPKFSVEQVKEKWSFRHVELNGNGGFELSNAVEAVRDESERTCEACGAEAKLARLANRWVTTLCGAHLVDGAQYLPKIDRSPSLPNDVQPT